MKILLGLFLACQLGFIHASLGSKREVDGKSKAEKREACQKKPLYKSPRRLAEERLLHIATIGGNSNAELQEIQNAIDKHNINLDVCKPGNITALMIASRQNNIRLATFLLTRNKMSNGQARADVNAQALYGNTALHMACSNEGESYYPMVALLLTHGANVNVRGYLKKTPIMVAITVALSNDLAFNTIRLLLNANANLSIEDTYGDCALGYSIKLLIQRSKSQNKKILMDLLGFDIEQPVQAQAQPTIIAPKEQHKTNK